MKLNKVAKLKQKTIGDGNAFDVAVSFIKNNPLSGGNNHAKLDNM